MELQKKFTTDCREQFGYFRIERMRNKVKEGE